jgi:hypothetical protein
MLDDPRQLRQVLPDLRAPDHRRGTVSETAGARCEACGAPLAERQRWCLACGAGTLTQIATTRHWAAASAAAALIGVLALVGIGYAVATLLSS